MGSPTVVIVNPASRNRATGRRFRQVEDALRERLGELRVEATRGPRDAERIAREAVTAGAETLIVAGGDGTASEVVAGLLGAGAGDAVRLAFLPLGTGGDLGRTLGTPPRVPEAAAAIAAGRERRIDAGRLDVRTPAGDPHRTHFVNIASGGLSGCVDRLVNEAPKSLGGTASFLIGTLRALFTYRDVPCRVALDGDVLHDGPIVLATAANGRYFGGGMHVAPEARLDDGRLDVVVIPGAPRWRLLSAMPELYRGRHLDRPEVIFRTGQRLVLEPRGPLLLDVDGECLPAAHASFEILPSALRVVTP